ncbi:MAG: GNAT family N-acetyltransferase [Thermoplasmata archaeon]
MQGAVGGSRSGFRFRRLEKPEEFRAAEELQRQAYGLEGALPLGATFQRMVQDHGGLVLGAFADIYLAGLTAGFLGWDGTQLYHCTVTTAVRPEYQNHAVGFRLHTYLREEVLAQGLPRIVGTFDPLQSRAAHLILRRLGAVPERYLTHYFGQLDSRSDRGIETDRVRFRWDLALPAVEARLAAPRPPSEEDRNRWTGSMAVVETTVSEEGFRRPASVGEPSGGSAHLEIPFDLEAIRQNAPALLRPWRHAVRDGFRAALDLGWQVDDFVVLTLEHERRGFYLLRPPAPPPTEATPATGTA